MDNPPTLLQRKRRAFTLLEIVLSLAITTLLLTGATFFLFSLSNIWLKAETEPSLDQHYFGVTRFLQYVMTQAKTTDSGSSGSSGGSYANISWGYPPNESTAGDPLIQFSLAEPLPLFVWDEGPLPDLTCWLLLEEDEGLYIVWKPAKESKEYNFDIYRTLISRLVTKISYLYYDDSSETWEEDDSPPSETSVSGTLKAVNFTFNLDSQERVFQVYLQKKPSSIPFIY